MLNKLTLKDKALFDRYLRLSDHNLSVYSFENIFIWGKLFDIRWLIIRDCLYVFFKDSCSCFLYLEPLGKKLNPDAIEEAFCIMDEYNKNKDFSRIENAEEKNLDFYRRQGYQCVQKSYDYLCKRENLAGLRGNRFKSKRAAFNYFSKHYASDYLPFLPEHKKDCLKLYREWSSGRRFQNNDPLYRQMLEDNFSALNVLLDNYRSLSLTARVIRVNHQIRAFTFGFKLNKDTFCVLYEITDLDIKGLAQYIFCRFARELKKYRYFNIMEDSGLENLRQTKLSFHPESLIPAFIVQRER